MSGLYIHIPFCKKACHYCNFHFSTSLKYKDDMLQAILKEIAMQKDYLPTKTLETVYFGGGTPSLLSHNDLEQIFEQINQYFNIHPNAEITLEANPDDLTPTKLRELKQSPINRLSIGVQSFSDEDLQFMNRAHNTDEASSCIKNAQDIGFQNLTIDLIYGTPTMDNAQWETNLAMTFALDIPHISCYCLTVEPNTALDHFVKKGKAKPVDEEQAAQQFEYLMQQMKTQGYEHYEISNFSKPNDYARHNTAYWLGKSYLGLGPSAHSFNGHSRQWNVANNAKYIQAIQGDNLPFVLEELSNIEQFNEYLLTSLRTMWGCDFGKIQAWGSIFEAHFLKEAKPFLDTKTMIKKGNKYYLTNEGRLLADHIISELFYSAS